MTSPTRTHLQYELIEGNIHHFTLLNLSNDAVDELFKHLEKITHDTPSTETNRYLLDTRGTRDMGIPHLMHTTRRANSFFLRFPQRPFSRVAILSEQGIVVDMVNQFIRGMNARDKTHFFRKDQYDDAIEWLSTKD